MAFSGVELESSAALNCASLTEQVFPASISDMLLPLPRERANSGSRARSFTVPHSIVIYPYPTRRMSTRSLSCSFTWVRHN